MTRDIWAWVMAVGGVIAAFGGLRLYSVVFADAAAAADIRANEGGLWAVALLVGIILLAAGWWMRRRKQTA